MASMDPSTERRMHARHMTQRDDHAISTNTALNMFLLMVAIMLMLGAAYYYATYSQESAAFDALFGINIEKPSQLAS